MRLGSLLDALPRDLLVRAPDSDPVIRGVGYDSRAVAPGDLFFALRGASFDGHAYLAQALDLGAAAVVVEDVPSGLDLAGRPAVVVRDSRRALAPLARAFYGDPAGELALIGVTGTNGKTSVTYLLESILARAGRRVGIVGTVEIRYPGARERSLNTTPESLDLQRTLRAMRTQGVEAAVMEVSSHGLALGRVEGCRFAVGAFTNLTQDHLDFHESMDAYRDAKALMFSRHLAEGGCAVLNAEDPAAAHFEEVARAAGATVVRVGRDPASGSDVAIEAAEVQLDGTRARIRLPGATVDVALPLVGDFNLENLLVACGVASALDIEPDAIAAGVAACPQVPGRVERIDADVPDAPVVVVDYAHTPDAVEKLLRALRPLTSGRLVTVFGCGGDRDRAKRALMAEAAARFSDCILATSDNPRREDPLRILDDVEKGLSSRTRVEPDALHAAATGAYAVVPDRREAIRIAVALGRPGDTVVIAGKGHEDYQIVGDEKLPFSDPDEARRALRGRVAP